MSRHLRLVAFCAGLLASAGCSNERRLPTEPPPAGPIAPTAPSPPQPSPDPQRLAAHALFDAVVLHAELTTSPITLPPGEEGKVWTDGPCYSGQGSARGSLDGGLSPAAGTFLPTGSHTYVVSYSHCAAVFWGGEGYELNGVASAAYTAAEWSQLTAMVSAESVRGHGSFVIGPKDVTAEGSAVWTRVGLWSDPTRTTTYTPAPGSRLVNNATSNVATFGGGWYSSSHYDSGYRLERRFENLKVAINGTEYTLDGTLAQTSGTPSTYTGEIRILNSGTLVARIYGSAGDPRTVEVLAPLVPF